MGKIFGKKHKRLLLQLGRGSQQKLVREIDLLSSVEEREAVPGLLSDGKEEGLVGNLASGTLNINDENQETAVRL